MVNLRLTLKGAATIVLQAGRRQEKPQNSKHLQVMSGPKSKIGNRRTEDRKPVELPGTLILEDGSEPCIIFDISPRGAQVSACQRAPLDRPIRLKLTKHGEFIGKVVWRNGTRMGLEFLHLSDDVGWPPGPPGPDIRLVS